MSQHLFTGVVLGAVFWILASLGTAGAETILIDDFNDGNDDGWTHHAPDFLAPGIFVVEDGAYHIRSAVKTNEDPNNWLISLWDASEDPRFSNGFMTMKVRANADGVAAGAAMAQVLELSPCIGSVAAAPSTGSPTGNGIRGRQSRYLA